MLPLRWRTGWSFTHSNMLHWEIEWRRTALCPSHFNFMCSLLMRFHILSGNHSLYISYPSFFWSRILLGIIQIPFILFQTYFYDLIPNLPFLRLLSTFHFLWFAFHSDSIQFLYIHFASNWNLNLHFLLPFLHPSALASCTSARTLLIVFKYSYTRPPRCSIATISMGICISPQLSSTMLYSSKIKHIRFCHCLPTLNIWIVCGAVQHNHPWKINDHTTSKGIIPNRRTFVHNAKLLYSMEKIKYSKTLMVIVHTYGWN